MVDVCLLVEGAYPYVTGGMSSWLHALITNLPDMTFAILYIGARPDPARKAVYRLPDNVLEFREVFINDINKVQRQKKAASRRVTSHASAWHDFAALHEVIALGKPYERKFAQPMACETGFAGLTTADLFYARASWEHLIALYQRYSPQEPFVDFFWTFRFTYFPIFTIFETVLPQASVYHAVSTGFCGLLGALAKIRYGRPFLLTEHGLYTREREIEISQSPWLSQLNPLSPKQRQRMGFFQNWWFNIYRFMEQVTYDTADEIISITAVNQQYQLQRGADPHKLKLIPNGIDIARLAHLHRSGNSTQETFHIGFVGRIVPIKDVKTLLRAIKIATQTIPRLQVYLVGPVAEDPEYYQECCRLASLLNLDDCVHFTGPADVHEYYKLMDVMVLTSLSEGQPLVILEASSAGVPVVATHVGACRELLEGTSAADRALGPSGLITPVSSPDETASALVHLWRDKDLCLRMGCAGQERTRRFYSQEQLYHTYDTLYRSYIAKSGYTEGGNRDLHSYPRSGDQ